MIAHISMVILSVILTFLGFKDPNYVPKKESADYVPMLIIFILILTILEILWKNI